MFSVAIVRFVLLFFVMALILTSASPTYGSGRRRMVRPRRIVRQPVARSGDVNKTKGDTNVSLGFEFSPQFNPNLGGK